MTKVASKRRKLKVAIVRAKMLGVADLPQWLVKEATTANLPAYRITIALAQVETIITNHELTTS